MARGLAWLLRWYPKGASQVAAHPTPFRVRPLHFTDHLHHSTRPPRRSCTRRYGTRYSLQPLPEEWLDTWRGASVHSMPGLHLPAPNDFIPAKLALLPVSCAPGRLYEKTKCMSGHQRQRCAGRLGSCGGSSHPGVPWRSSRPAGPACLHISASAPSNCDILRCRRPPRRPLWFWTVSRRGSGCAQNPRSRCAGPSGRCAMPRRHHSVLAALFPPRQCCMTPGPLKATAPLIQGCCAPGSAPAKLPARASLLPASTYPSSLPLSSGSRRRRRRACRSPRPPFTFISTCPRPTPPLGPPC